MGLRVSTNMAAMAANRTLVKTNDMQNKSFQRLSSGQRITQAGDDAAGLSISENLRAQIRSMGEAEKNASTGVSLVQVAEGGLSKSAISWYACVSWPSRQPPTRSATRSEASSIRNSRA